MENYPWYKKLFESLNCYYAWTKKVATALNSDCSDKAIVVQLRMILIDTEECLLNVERIILSEQLALVEEDVIECQEKFQAGSIRCNLFLN